MLCRKNIFRFRERSHRGTYVYTRDFSYVQFMIESDKIQATKEAPNQKGLNQTAFISFGYEAIEIFLNANILFQQTLTRNCPLFTMITFNVEVEIK